MKKMRKVLAFVLAMSLVMSSLCTAAFADTTESNDLVAKTATEIEDERYQIELKVPGKDPEIVHDEIIMMVDGSYSLDQEWPAMKEAINTIGKTVLNGYGNTQLTLMAFGMGDNEVLVHVKDAAELESALGELPGTLLYGRSSTNCEAGFDGVANYIANHDDSLNDVHVIYISDGNVNTDETPRAFDANWKTWTKFGALFVAQAALEETVLYGENLPTALETVFGNRFDGLEKEEILDKAFGGEVTEEEFLAFAEQIWTDVYAYSDLTRGEEYPVSVAERAFVKYDKEMGTYIQDLFYYTTYKSAYVTYPDRWTRTPVAADELAAMTEVASMYVVDYDGYTSWMDTGITSEKSAFIQSNGITGLCAALEGALTNLAKTPYNDVVVTDYMSKWVNLDKESIKIVNTVTGETIWSVTDGWLISENIPTAAEPPVAVELVDPANYEAGGSEVVGNTNGDIYKLTWSVKDGALLRSECYSLVYDVTVDTEEEGFVSETEYDANGTTTVEYVDEDDEPQKEEITVPTVTGVKEITVSVDKAWAGDTEAERPAEIKVQLFQDGVAYGDPITLTAESGWTYTFEGLEDIYDWTVEEVNVPENYTASVSVDGNKVVITNTFEAPEQELPEDDTTKDDPQDDPVVEEDPKPELPEDENVIDEPKDDPVVEEDPKPELPEDENVIDEPQDDPVVEEDPKPELPEDENIIDEPEQEPVVEEEEPQQELPEDENIIDVPVIEPAPDTGDTAPVAMLLILAGVSLASLVTLSYRRK